ncbi:cadherin-like beta sandwich domain-containing protein [Neobacillus drentensis]|uniref:cadherin-like beta sandwich domain-containing protein n=1 Tax=Neobacillus drentensis TaxID=220684 RepID=UPI003000D722
MTQSKPIKVLNVLLVFSMVWMGVGSFIPSVSAETNPPTVQENQPGNTLSKLELEGIELDQKFATDLYDYSATVGNDVETINLLVESTITDSIITINGQAVISGAKGTYSLQTGENKFIISIDDGSGSVNTYTLTISREKNANNLLQNIELSKGKLSPQFSYAVSDYSVEVPNQVPVITIKPVAVQTTSTIKVNNILVNKDGVDVPLPVGRTNILITVTAENGELKTYTIHVTRVKVVDVKGTTPNQSNKPGATTQPSSKPTNRVNSGQPTSQIPSAVSTEKVSKALLSSLSVSEGTWDSTFSSDEFTYHVKVSSNVDEITLKPIATYSSSEILIEGSTSKTIKLENDKKTIISIVVTNDNNDRKTYVLVFDRKS